MPVFFDYILTILTLFATVPIVFFILEIIGFFLTKNGYKNTDKNHSPIFDGSVAIIIPAHNESASLLPTLESLLYQCQEKDRIIVVADNCTDDTALIARKAFEGSPNKQVIERHDIEHRGKGYALAFALEALKASPPDIVLIVDADCIVANDTCAKLAERTYQTGRPAQGLYLMEQAENGGPIQAVATFAWMMMNHIRMQGLYTLFDVTRLTGSGMAFPWRILNEYFQGSANIVEDLALTITLVENNYAPLFVPTALITSTFPNHDKAMATQRARWEQGSLTMGRRSFFPLFIKAIKKQDHRMIALAFDITIPPLTIAGIGLFFLLGLATIPALFGSTVALTLTLINSFLFGGALFAIWIHKGRSVLPLSSMLGIFPFLYQKKRVYGQEGRQSAATWTRTDRKTHDPVSKDD